MLASIELLMASTLAASMYYVVDVARQKVPEKVFSAFRTLCVAHDGLLSEVACQYLKALS